MIPRNFLIFTSVLLWGTFFPSTIVSEEIREERKVTIVTPISGITSTNPVKVCMEVEGLILEPAVNGVAEGKGHHHILFSSLPKDLSKPIPRKRAIHMVKGQKCIKLKLEPGNHVIIALFSYGNQIPYDPPILDRILIKIDE